ncbi:MAG: DUF5666 domain-containing protein [Anaerolineae bacterium]|nr:DUF5666 domain-containing protein [Anaerolineae bacterium]
MKKSTWFGILLLAGMGLALAACATAPGSGEGAMARWEGTVEAVLPDGLQVSGRMVRWTGQTQVIGDIQVGSRVEVEGVQTGDVLSATVIRAQSSDGSTAAISGGTAGTRVSPLPTPAPPMEFRGLVEAALPNGYRISGQMVIVTTTTRIEGPVAVGTFVKVKGILLTDGSVLALQIKVEAPEAQIQLKGVVDAILPNGYRIAGRTVMVTTTTRIDGPITVGTFVKVKGLLQPDGTILASRIHREEEVKFTGIVEAILSNGYRISGRTVVITDITEVKDPVAVGDWVEVKGFLQGDGSILAREIRVKRAPKSTRVEFKGTVEEVLSDGYRIAGIRVVVTATTQIDGPITVGTFVEVKGVFQPDGSVLAFRIRVERPKPAGGEIEFKGTVEAILSNGYQVSGRTVVVTTTTQIDGPITVGTFVEVKGIVQPDGTVLALRIHIEDQKADKGEVEFKGVVEAILSDGYRIAGRRIQVDGSTQIDGMIVVGAFVEVKGFVRDDGSIRAVRIHLEDDQKSGSGKVEDNRKSGDGKEDEKNRNDDGKPEEKHDEDQDD